MWIIANVVQGTSVILSTLFACYGIAVYFGHVPAWPLPMMSDFAVLPPEKYLFRLGIVTGAVFLAVGSNLMYHADKSFSHSKLGLVLGMMAALSLAVVGAVNKKENYTIHFS